MKVPAARPHNEWRGAMAVERRREDTFIRGVHIDDDEVRGL